MSYMSNQLYIAPLISQSSVKLYLIDHLQVALEMYLLSYMCL